MIIRLAKYIAQAGFCSRRQAEELIKAGEVKVNNITAEITTPFNPEEDTLTVKGEHLNSEKKVYILLNKPRGYLSTCKAGKEKGKTILDLVKVNERIYPVGRLDKDSRGLIILTNDGESAHRLMHPSYEIEKEYIVKLNKPLTIKDIERLKSGIEIEEKTYRFHRISHVDNSVYNIVLKQGMKRQIRLMIDAVNKKVIDLQRIREGKITLNSLPEGKWRFLNSEETTYLKGAK